jgi:hypothetical protein
MTNKERDLARRIRFLLLRCRLKAVMKRDAETFRKIVKG